MTHAHADPLTTRSDERPIAPTDGSSARLASQSWEDSTFLCLPERETTLSVTCNYRTQGQDKMETKQLLGRGFLPEILPLAFTSAGFAAVWDSLTYADASEVVKQWCESGIVNVARPGGLRRRMTLVNPFKQRPPRPCLR